MINTNSVFASVAMLLSLRFNSPGLPLVIAVILNFLVCFTAVLA